MERTHILLTVTRLLSLVVYSVVYAPVSAGTGDVLAAYALYAQNQDSGKTVTLARVVLDGEGQVCPEITSVTSMQVRVNPDQANFPVTVCEGLYSSTTPVLVPGSSVSLPAIKVAPKQVVVFGDSGYEHKQLEEGIWVFPELANQAAKASPDVVLHMGDYNYSGTPGTITVNGQSVQVYDAGDNTTQGMCKIPGGYHGQNSHGSATPDSWAAWKSNFFEAAQGLLSAAPFVFLRGNHELCSRAGPGWFYLLDSNSPLLGKYAQQLNCPAAENPTPMVMTPPFQVSAGQLSLLVLDSANACDSGRLNVNDYVNQFALMNRLHHNVPKAKQTWLLSHRPLWGVDGLAEVGACGNGNNDYCYTTQTLQAANEKTGLSDIFDLVLSGHMHRFQLVDFSSFSHPDQFVIGNSGVKLAKQYPKKTTRLLINGHKATVMGVKEFGYMSFTLSGSEWSGNLKGVGDATLFQCQAHSYPMCATQ